MSRKFTFQPSMAMSEKETEETKTLPLFGFVTEKEYNEAMSQVIRRPTPSSPGIKVTYPDDVFGKELGEPIVPGR